MAATCIAFAGCASGPKFSDIQSKIPAVKSGDGRIFIYRDSIFGAAIQPKIYLNGSEIGISQSNGFFYVDRPAGDYRLSGSTEVERSLSLALSANETKYVRTSMSLGVVAGRMNFELVNSVAGQAAIQGLSFTGAIVAAHAAVVPVSTIAASDAQALTGQWEGTYKCSRHLQTNAAGFSVPVRITVAGSQVTMSRSISGNYTETSTGTVAADLSVNLSGRGQMEQPPQTTWLSQFAGQFSGTGKDSTFKATGNLRLQSGSNIRDCDIQMSRTKTS